MLAYLATRPGTGIAAWHCDRLTRNDQDRIVLADLCMAGGHLIETARGGSYDLSTATGRKRFRDDASDAAYEVDHMTERITAQKMEAAAEGEWLGGPVPFGWQKDRSGDLAMCRAEAEAVRIATADIAEGVSLHAITRRWNESGLTTKRGNRWRASEVRALLLRARNAGLYVHHGKLQAGVTGQWPPIVTEAEWRACRAILTDPGRRTTTSNERRHLGSGLYLCGVCGHTLITSGVAGKGRPMRRVYRCAAGRRHVTRDAGNLDAYVEAIVVEWMRAAGPALRPPPADTTRLRTELAGVRAEQAELAESQARAELTVRQVAIMTGPLLEREARLEAEMAVAQIPSPLEPFAAGDPAEIWCALDLDRQRAVVAALMTVTVHPAPKGRLPGWKTGEPYFHVGSVEVEPVRPAAGG